MTRPRHLHLVHDREPEPELEAETVVNWGLIVAIAGCLLVWAGIIAVVLLLV